MKKMISVILSAILLIGLVPGALVHEASAVDSADGYYDDLVKNNDYLAYMDYDEGYVGEEPPTEYTLLDIDQNGINELILMDNSDVFRNYMVFTYDLQQGMPVYVGTVYGYGNIMYNPLLKSIWIRTTRPSKSGTGSSYYKMQNNAFNEVPADEIDEAEALLRNEKQIDISELEEDVEFSDLSEYQFAVKYIYDEGNPAENLDFTNILSDVTDRQTAEKAIEDGISKMTPEQKSSSTGVDKATLLAEEATARANMKPLSGGSLNLKKDDLSSDTRTTVTVAEKVLNKSGIETQRVPRAIQTYDAGDNKKISVQNEILSGDVDQIRVSADFASATASAKQANNFTMEDRGNKTVEVKFNTSGDNLVTVSFPGISADDKYMAVVDENGNPVGGKYNPVTGTLEAKLTASGIYRVVNNEKDFADIKSKSKEMQDAVKLLASKGVINGTSETTFAPDSTISRAEIAALLMRTLSLLDPNANGGFTDVTSANWFYDAAGSAKKHNIISGFEDNTFRGLNVIAKNQIVAVAARTLRQQMNYKTPSDIAKELSVYGDSANVESWVREDVALATMCNLVMKRTDGNFGGTANMTRGDAAIIIRRLFDKIW